MTDESILYELVYDTLPNGEVCIDPFLLPAIILAGVVISLFMLDSGLFDGGTPDFVETWRKDKFKKLYLSGQIYRALSYADKYSIPIHKIALKNNDIAVKELLVHVSNYLRIFHAKHGTNWQLHAEYLSTVIWFNLALHYCCARPPYLCGTDIFEQNYRHIRKQVVEDGKDVLILLNELQNYKNE